MEMNDAIRALGALAHEHRLSVFRMLIAEGPNGLAAGTIASRLGVAPSSLSFHLSQLAGAGLLTSRRESRQIIYAADIEGTRRMLGYLTEDCCNGNPDICADLTKAPACAG